MAADVEVPLVEATDKVEDEGAVRNDLTEVPDVVRHALYLAAVVGDGEVALLGVAELGVEDERTCIPVAKEPRVNPKPGDAGADPTIEGCVNDGGGEGALKPRLDHAIRTDPIR